MALIKSGNQKFALYETNHADDFILKPLNFVRCPICNRLIVNNGKGLLRHHLRYFSCRGEGNEGMLNTCCGKARPVLDFLKHRKRIHHEGFTAANSQRLIQNESKARDLLGPFNIKYETTIAYNFKSTRVVYDSLATFNNMGTVTEEEDDDYDD